MEKITIRAFRAVDDKAACARYIMEFMRVLEDIGVSASFRPDVGWCADPDSIVFVAEHEVHGMVGGIRLQRANGRAPLPMESSLSELAPGLPQVLDYYRSAGNAELGALWNAHRFAGRGIPYLLISAAVAAASQLALGSMCCLVAEYVAPYCRSNGFEPIIEVGDQGRFTFPIPSISSYAMVIPHVDLNLGAEDEERHRILSLRLRPDQVRIEQPKREPLEVTYALLLNRADTRYRAVAAYRSRFAA